MHTYINDLQYPGYRVKVVWKINVMVISTDEATTRRQATKGYGGKTIHELNNVSLSTKVTISLHS